MVHDQMPFNPLREMPGPDGLNLSIHLFKLEKNAYLAVHRKFIRKKPQASNSATAKRKKAFQAYLDGLEKITRGNHLKK